MLKQIARLKIGLVILLGILLSCSSVFAMGDRVSGGYNNRGDSRDNNRSDNRDNNREDRHYYRDGKWYKLDSQGREVTVADLIIGALVEAPPPQHTTVIIQGAPYYYDNRHYYQQRPNGGYVVVEPPRGR